MTLPSLDVDTIPEQPHEALLAPGVMRCKLASDCDFSGTWQAYLAHAPVHQLPHPRDRAPWLDSRRTFVGASEIAAVVGANPYAGPLEVWSAKIRPRPEPVFVPRILEGGGRVVMPNHQVGQLAELPLLEDFARRHRCKLTQPATARHPEKLWLAATPDGDVAGGPLVQVKKVGHRVDWVGDWDAGPPIYTLLQVQTEMAVWGRDRCIILADIGELREYEVSFDAELIGPAIEIAAAFWRYVEQAATPTDFDLRATQADTLRWLWPEATVLGLQQADEEAIKVARLYVAARDAEKIGGDDKDALSAQLKAMLGDREGVYWGPSEKKNIGKITWTNNKPGVRHKDLALALLEELVGDEAERVKWVKRFTDTVGTRVLRVTVKGS